MKPTIQNKERHRNAPAKVSRLTNNKTWEHYKAEAVGRKGKFSPEALKLAITLFKKDKGTFITAEKKKHAEEIAKQKAKDAAKELAKKLKKETTGYQGANYNPNYKSSMKTTGMGGTYKKQGTRGPNAVRGWDSRSGLGSNTPWQKHARPAKPSGKKPISRPK